MIRTPTLKLAGAAIAAAALSLPLVATAQPSAHYVPGLEGIKAATLPPPGLYLRDYNVAYFSDRLNDRNGDEIKAADAEAFIYANAPRLVWITDYKLLGGYIGVDALVPFQYTSLEATTGNGRFDDSTFGIGDAFAEVTMSWHEKQFDAAIGYGIWAPTGDSAAGLTTRAGSGFWTHMLTAGATFYPDEAKKWSISALNRYEINTEKEYTDITPGDAWTIEGSIARSFSPTVDAGVVAYYQRQVEGDKGAQAGAERDWVTAVGPEISVFYPRVTLGWSLRYLYEVAAENRLQGHTAVLTVTKRF